MNNSFTDNTLRSGSSEPASLGDATTMKGAPDGVGALGRIDQYELVRELGGGGFGVVFLARDAVSGVDVAVKGLPPLVRHNREELAHIRENFALVARLHHPHIAAALVLHPAREVWYADEAVRRALRVDPGDTLMVMEYAPGTTLGNWRKQFPEGRAPVERALEVCRQAAEALDYAHSQKIVHRDVKPSNLMIETGNSKLETGGGSPRVVARVLDFGLAAEIRSSMSRVSQEAGDTSGTRPYMAPEQWAGRRQDGRADQYALAVLFHELVGGAVPFASAFDTGDPVIMQSAVLNLAPEPSPWLSKAQNAVLLRALAKDPAARFATCSDFVAALGGAKVSSRSRGGRGGDGWDEATRRRGGRGGRRWLWAAAALVALAAGASVVSIRSIQSRNVRLAVERAALAEAAAQDSALRARVVGLEKAADAALTSGNLQEAGAKIAELEGMTGQGATVARLRKQYEALAGERETNTRYADASMAHDRAQKIDPGQTLGAKQEALERKWREAEAARQGRSWGQALSAYDAVIAQSGELVTLDAAREAAKTRRLASEQAKQSSEESKADTYAKDLDAEGGRAASRAAESFEKGDFAGAAKFWGEAAAEYAKARSRSVAVQAYDKAKTAYETAAASDLALLKAHGGKLWNEVNRQARLGEASVNDPATGAEAYRKAASGLPAAVAEARAAEKAAKLNAALAEAQSAKARENWAAVVAAADAALAIDAANAEAKRLKTEAEGNLAPTLTILAQTEDGREVAAEVRDGRNTWRTSQAIPLAAGASYAFEVSIPSNSSNPSIPSKRHAPATLAITADWRGPQTRRVTLAEIKGPTVGDVQKVSLASGVDLELVWCPPGTFTMGSPPGEVGRDDDEMQHEVTLTKGFWMGKTEVTQRQWEAVMGTPPSYFKNAGPDAPVEPASWNACQEFIRKVNARVPGGGFRLPTEAEWEYAAKGGNKSQGFTYAGGNDIDAVAWCLGKSRGSTHPVGQKTANELGLYDMSGNVREWCQDWSGDYPLGSVTDPSGPGSGSRRVLRGGTWMSPVRSCRSADRDGFDPGGVGIGLGLRLARDAPQPTGSVLSKAEADAAIAKARQLESAGQIEVARDQFLAVLDRLPESAQRIAQETVGRLSIALFVSPRPAKGKVVYVVKSGDSLSKIAAKFNCSDLLIKKANGFQDPARIRVGQTFVIPDHPAFSVLVSKSRNTLTVLLDDKLFKHYAVGTGTQSRTPAGTFKVVDKIADPPWWPGDGTAVVPYGDPKNILGTHLLALEATGDTPRVRGYGIHGTWDESTIGRQSSAGCVRMRNADVAEVFMLLPRGTPVTIVE